MRRAAVPALFLLLVYGAACIKTDPIAVVDVGGGSAEIVVGECCQPPMSVSLPLGALRLADADARLLDGIPQDLLIFHYAGFYKPRPDVVPHTDHSVVASILSRYSDSDRI